MLVAHSTGMFTLGRSDCARDRAAQPVKMAISSTTSEIRAMFLIIERLCTESPPNSESVHLNNATRFISLLQSETTLRRPDLVHLPYFVSVLPSSFPTLWSVSSHSRNLHQTYPTGMGVKSARGASVIRRSLLSLIRPGSESLVRKCLLFRRWKWVRKWTETIRSILGQPLALRRG
jgi:hypothetical protein